MSNFYGKRTFSNFNQLSRENPFRVIGSPYDPYSPNQANFNQQYNNNSPKNLKGEKTSSYIPYERSSNINDNKQRNNSTQPLINNSYNIINSNIYAKNSKPNYSSYKQNRDHVAELFNYNYKDTPQYYKGNTTNKEASQLPYSTYTTPKVRNNKNNYKADDNSNNIKGEKISNVDSSEYYEENNDLIKNYAYKENPNKNFRDYMEDKGRSIIGINGDPDKALFCLFDGHGGDQVSKFLQNNFIKYFKEMLPFNNINQDLINLFKKLDEKIKELNCYQVGSTACIIYITKEKGKKILYSANIGDTRSILISKNDYKRLSYDHRANDDKEYKRIINDGGIVFGGRIYGTLMLGRAFGDWELKAYGVSSEPHITKINISDNDKYVILATDGVWDVLEEMEVYDLSKKYDNSKDLCNKIINNSIEKGSNDNISCFVICL